MKRKSEGTEKKPLKKPKRHNPPYKVSWANYTGYGRHRKLSIETKEYDTLKAACEESLDLGRRIKIQDRSRRILFYDHCRGTLEEFPELGIKTPEQKRKEEAQRWKQENLDKMEGTWYRFNVLRNRPYAAEDPNPRYEGPYSVVWKELSDARFGDSHSTHVMTVQEIPEQVIWEADQGKGIVPREIVEGDHLVVHWPNSVGIYKNGDTWDVDWYLH